jgi:hypothetical protein
MARKCFISFKTEDMPYKVALQGMGIDMVDKSLDDPIDSYDEDYIMRRIRDEYLSDSTVTIHLIGSQSAGNLGDDEQYFIKKELQASLYNGEGNSRSGILGVVLPSVYSSVYTGSINCSPCASTISSVDVGDSTTISEFHANYHIPHGKCHWTDDDRYCELVKWGDFILDPESYIEKAYQKRFHPISNKVRVRP